MFVYYCDRCKKEVKSHRVWTVRVKYATSDIVNSKHLCTSCKSRFDEFMETITESELENTESVEDSQAEVQEDDVPVKTATKAKREITLDLAAKNNEVPQFEEFMKSKCKKLNCSEQVAKEIIALKLDGQKMTKIAEHYGLTYSAVYMFVDKYDAFVKG